MTMEYEELYADLLREFLFTLVILLGCILFAWLLPKLHVYLVRRRIRKLKAEWNETGDR